jgi:hypothetical protein
MDRKLTDEQKGLLRELRTWGKGYCLAHGSELKPLLDDMCAKSYLHYKEGRYYIGKAKPIIMTPQVAAENELRTAIKALDKVLTNQTERAVDHMAQRVHIDSFITGENYYLSDGGYSRIFINPWGETDVLSLATESTNTVKGRWTECQAERDMVAKLVKPFRDGTYTYGAG